MLSQKLMAVVQSSKWPRAFVTMATMVVTMTAALCLVTLRSTPFLTTGSLDEQAQHACHKHKARKRQVGAVLAKASVHTSSVRASPATSQVTRGLAPSRGLHSKTKATHSKVSQDRPGGERPQPLARGQSLMGLEMFRLV